MGVVRYAYAPNLDEFHLVGHATHVRGVLRPGDLEGSDLVILPGSKHMAADATMCRERRLG